MSVPVSVPEAEPEPEPAMGREAAHPGFVSEPIAAGDHRATRRAILVALRRHGPSTLDDLGHALGVSRGAILGQLRSLETAGLIGRSTQRHGVGRPRIRYDVTADAQTLLPANYDGLAVGLLAAIESVGGTDLVEDVLLARRRQLGERVRATVAARVGPNATLPDRVRALAVFQDEQGYLSEDFVAADGSIGLREHNCAIFHAARQVPQACAAELELFRDVLGADVVREKHILAGDRCCSYRVSERPS